jgi:hypothetical protein
MDQHINIVRLVINTIMTPDNATILRKSINPRPS